MQTYTFTFTRLRSAVSLMVLLAVVTALLPMQRASAIPSPVLNLTREEVNEQLLVSWSKSHASPLGNSYKGISTERTIQQLLVADQLLVDAAFDPDVIFKQADALQERYIQRLGSRGTDPAYRDSLPNSVIV